MFRRTRIQIARSCERTARAPPAGPRRPHLQAGVVAVGRQWRLRAASVSQLGVHEQVVLALVAPRAGPSHDPGRAAPPRPGRWALVHNGDAGLAPGPAPRGDAWAVPVGPLGTVRATRRTVPGHTGAQTPG